MWKIYLVDVKLQQNNQTEIAQKVSNDILLKQILKYWTKNVTRQNFYTVPSNMFEFNYEFFTKVDEYKSHKTLTNWRLLNVILIRLKFLIHSHPFHFW